MYIIGYFPKNDFFVWLWKHYCFVYSLLLDLLRAYMCKLFHSIWTIVEGMFAPFFQGMIAMCIGAKIIILYSVHWLILYLLRSECCFIPLFNFYSVYVFGCFTISDYFVGLWNDKYFLSSMSIDYLLALFCMPFNLNYQQFLLGKIKWCNFYVS